VLLVFLTNAGVLTINNVGVDKNYVSKIA